MSAPKRGEMREHISRTLKDYRKERGWNLDVASGHTGVSKAMLGQIERGESSPTVDTLWKIATGFNVSVSSFLEDPDALFPSPMLRVSDELRRHPHEEGMLVALLFPFDPRFGFEFFELTLVPGYERVSQPHAPGVVEHVIVIRGNMELLIEGNWKPLGEGEAIRFPADAEHGYRNVSDEPVVFHNLIHYQD